MKLKSAKNSQKYKPSLSSTKTTTLPFPPLELAGNREGACAALINLVTEIYSIPKSYSEHRSNMDQLMTYWFSGKSKEMEDAGKDIKDVPKKISGGATKMVNNMTGKKQKPLSELLHEFELPAGLFPREAKHYEFDKETNKLTVTLPTICEVSYRDSSVLRFSTSVTGLIEKGKISEIEGLKTRVVIWVKVTCIICEDMNLHFTAGLKKTRSKKVYENVRDGITVDKF